MMTAWVRAARVLYGSGTLLSPSPELILTDEGDIADKWSNAGDALFDDSMLELISFLVVSWYGD